MPVTEEEFLAASLAAQTTGYMRGILRGSDDAYNIVRGNNQTDWRRILRNIGPSGQQRPQQFPQQHPQQQFQPDPNYGNFGGEELLEGNVPTNISQIPMPRDANGNIIIPPEIQQQMGGQHMAPDAGLNIGGFNVPNYGKQAVQGISEDKADQIIKEIKLLKRAVSTLTNLIKKSMVLEGPEDGELPPEPKEKPEKPEKPAKQEKPSGLPSITFSSETKL